MKQLHLISGLPRSGSTLLCQLLNMNPDFSATYTSPMRDMLLAQQTVYSHNAGFKAVDRLEKYDDFAEAQKAFLYTYYKGDNIVFDKNRGWPADFMKMDEILDDENTKILWTYRNPIEVIASIEKQHRKTPLIQYTEEQNSPGVLGTLDSRISHLIGDAGIITMPVKALHEAIHTGYEDRIYIVNYSTLCKEPQDTLNKIHEFLGIDPYDYAKNNWEDLKQVTKEHDHLYNYKFPHDIKEGILSEVTHDTSFLDSYKDTVEKRYEWLNNHCRKEIMKESTKRTSRSTRELK